MLAGVTNYLSLAATDTESAVCACRDGLPFPPFGLAYDL